MNNPLDNRQVLAFNVEIAPDTGEHKLKDEFFIPEDIQAPTLAGTLEILRQSSWNPIGHCMTFNDRRVPVWELAETGKKIAIFELVRWMMWVDLEGFSYLYRDEVGERAIWGVHCLMKDLYSIGNVVYSCDNNRLFMHQVGDGFIIKPDFGDIDLLRPLAIGTALFRAALLRGYCLKAGIGLGGLADIKGCYPENIMNTCDDGCVQMGDGLMTVFPVMGDGLIDSHAISEKASGPIIIVRKDLADAVPEHGFPRIDYKSHFEIDWIHAESTEIDKIMHVFEMDATRDILKDKMKEYLDQNFSMSDAWRKSAELLLRSY